jgi:hypothetical protein
MFAATIIIKFKKLLPLEVRIKIPIVLKFNAIINIILFLLITGFVSVAQAKPCLKIDYIIGDSIAAQMQGNIDCQIKHFYLDSKGARTPSMILNAIIAAKKVNPHLFDGANVILSSGASNDPGRNEPQPFATQADKIEAQLKELSGAKHIYLLGVGPGYNNNLKIIGWNIILYNLSKKYSNVEFIGPLVTYKDPVHLRPRPNTDYQDLFNAITIQN